MFFRKMIFRLRTRVQLRQAARELGIPRDEIDDRMSELSDNDIDAAVEQVGASSKVNKILAIGDGSIIGWIIDFFKSPMGKMLLDLLLGLLFGMAASESVPEGMIETTTASAEKYRTFEPINKTSVASQGKEIMTKGVLDYLRLLRSLKEAIRSRDLAAIVKLVRDIGKAVDFDAEAGPLADVILYAAQGEWAKVADALGRFLIAVAANFLTGFSIMSESKAQNDQVIAEIASVIKLL